ncbi:S-layer homology domain-containing protein [Lysinibacillus capsici]|uniref:S-layer homology domain-containing protein n=1 Tax=Lysinibacillus capsici TaxID=2115968 RepID=UPI0021E6C8FD|nr:S-layer homology domain-containing protein [Lysinibacillus capsici]
MKQVAEKGLVAGYSDGTYNPSVQVTRAEFATFLSRVFDGNDRTPYHLNFPMSGLHIGQMKLFKRD